MSAQLLIANTGKKGKRKFVLRQVSKPKRGNPRKKAVRQNSWSERRSHPVLKAPKHRAAAYKGKGYSPKKAAAKARGNPNEYRAAFTRLKADMAKATRKAGAAAKAAHAAARRTNPANSVHAKSVAQRMAELRRRLNPSKSHAVGAPARKEKKMSKKHRSPAQKAATKKMLAANRKMRGNPGKKKAKGKKRKSGGRKKAATKRMIAANKKGGHKKRRSSGKKRRSSKKRHSAGHKKLARRLKSLRRAAKRHSASASVRKGWSKRKKASHRRSSSVRRARSAGIRARLSGASTTTLRKYGLTRVNPSPKGVLKDIWALAPELAVAAVAFAGVAYGSAKLVASLPDAVKNLWKVEGDQTATDKRAAYAPILGGIVLSVAGYFGLRMYPKVAKYAAPVAFGGVAAAAMSALVGVTVKNTGNVALADGSVPAEITLGKRLGLPIGEYVSVAGYVDVGGGRMMSVNGIGEYVSVAGIHQMSLPGGQAMRYEGSLGRGMGEYVLDPVGLSGGIFPTSASFGDLVDHTQSQVPLKRDPMWGLRGDPEGNVNIRKLLGQGDAGVSGGIFDRTR